MPFQFRARHLAAIALFLGAATVGPLYASETRVDAAGNLTSILTDETANLDLFLDGNPAGLMTLKTRDRFDLTGQWADQVPPSGPDSPSLGLVPRLLDDGIIRYGGLMLFPDPHWSVQLAGDVLSAPNQSWYFADNRTQGRYRSMVRAAVQLDALSLGVELFDAQFDHVYSTGLVKPLLGVTSGSSQENELKLRTGAILRLSGGADPDSPALDLGAVYFTHVGPDVENLQQTLFTLSGPFTLTQTTNSSIYNVFGPELLYQIPGRLIVRFSCFVTDNTTVVNQVTSSTNNFYQQSPNTFTNSTETIDSLGAFHLTLPVGGGENLKLGGNLEVISTYTTFQNETLFIYSDKNTQQLNGRIGIGLENPGHSTWGFQFTNRNSINNSQTSLGGATSNSSGNNYDFYKAVVGGERDLASDLFLDASVSAEFDVYYGLGSPNLWVPLLTLGPRLEEKGFKVETKFVLGETLDLVSGAGYGTELGAALSLTCFL